MLNFESDSEDTELTLLLAPVVEPGGVEVTQAVIGVHQAAQLPVSRHVETLQKIIVKFVKCS